MTAGNGPDWRGPGTALSAYAPSQPMFDVELGKIFLTMRSVLGISLWDMARRVGAEPTVIADLEAGALSALPPWPELTRLVDAYAAATGIDQQPILARLLRTQAPVESGNDPRIAQAPRTITVQPPSQGGPRGYYPQATAGQVPGMQARLSGPIPDSAFVPPNKTERAAVSAVPTEARRAIPGPRSVLDSAGLAANVEVVAAKSDLQEQVVRAVRSVLRGVHRVLLRRAVGFTGLVVLPGIVMLTAWAIPAVLYSVLAPLPSVVAQPLQAGVNQLVAAFAPEREGLTWIDIGDPRLRKTDRLAHRAR
jgi:hypothetical protein